MPSVFILTLLLQRSGCDGCSMDHDEELMNQVSDKVTAKGRTLDVRNIEIQAEGCDETMGDSCDQSGAAEAWWVNPTGPRIEDAI